MARTRDLGRSRQIIAERKQREAEARWNPDFQPDRSWMKWARCKICGTKVCLNNNDQREVQVRRQMGVFVCRSRQCWKMIPVYLYLKQRADKGDKKAKKLLKRFSCEPYPGEIPTRWTNRAEDI